jgi:hypothetical protein
MGFTLRHILTGESINFSTKEILEMLGDTVNDEIIVHDEVYRISSFSGTDSGDGAVPKLVWQNMNFKLSPKVETQNIFPFVLDTDGSNLFFTVNGVVYEYGIDKDYHTDGKFLYWHGGFNLDFNDIIYVKYLGLKY